MNKTSINKNNKYLTDKKNDEELLAKGNLIKKLIKKDARDFCSIGLLCACLTISAKSIKEFGSELVQACDLSYFSSLTTTQEHNDQTFAEIINNGYVSVFNFPMSIENRFYFNNQHLYNQENEIITLENYADPIYFASCNLDYQLLSNICLRESSTKSLFLNFLSIDNSCIECLPESVEELSLSYCYYLSDLSKLPSQCPNIKILNLDSLPSVKDYGFLAGLKKLEVVTIADSAYITEELIQYLDDRGIKHNLTEIDIENNRIINEIINEIITMDMSDKKKIQRICSYVLNHVEYDMKEVIDSNQHPLNCVLEDEKGVCISYAYLTHILLEKANINAYLLTSDIHAWNMVNIDGNYYYIDTTNMDKFSLNKLLLDVFNISVYYMEDTGISELQSGAVKISFDLLEDVLSGKNEKDVYEKYGGTISFYLIVLSYIIKSFFIVYSPKMIINIRRKSEKIIQDYKEYKDKIIRSLK